MLSCSQTAPAAQREKVGKEEVAAGLAAGRERARDQLAPAGGLEGCHRRAGERVPALQLARLCSHQLSRQRGDGDCRFSSLVPLACLEPALITGIRRQTVS